MLRKKLLKSYSVLSLAALSTISFLSLGCGQSVSIVSKGVDDSFFYVANPYHVGKQSWLAVNDIVESYNKFVEQKNKTLLEGEKKWLPAKTYFYGDSYNNVRDKVTNLLEIGAENELPSVSLGYSNLLSIYAKHGRELSFEGISLLDLAPAFRKIDTKIEGLAEEKAWVLPFGFSGVVNGINAPMLSFVVKTFQKLGAKVVDDSVEQQWFEKILSVGAFDEPKVEKVFGPITTDPAVLQKIRQYVFERKKWYNIVGLFEFGALISEAFPSYQHYVVSIDDPSRYLFTLLFTSLGNKPEEMPFKLVKANGRFTIKVDKMFDPSTPQFQNLKKLFELFQSMMLKRVLWVPNNSRSYGSTYLKAHQMIFEIGSSSGWEYTYELTNKLAAKRENKYLIPKALLFPSLKSRVAILSNLKLDNIDLTKEEVLDHGQFGYFIDESAKIKKIFMGGGSDGLEPPKAATSDDLIFTPEVTGKIKQLFAKDDGSLDDNFVVLDQADSSFFIGMPGVVSNFVYKNGSGKSFSNSAFALATQVVPLSNQDTVQPWELKSIFSPYSYDDNEKFKAFQVNGPVFMSFKVSPERDRNAANFAKFFISQKLWDRYRDGVLQERMTVTPATYFSLAGNYVPVTIKDLLQGSVPEAKANNEYFKVAFEGFRSAATETDSNISLYRSPAERTRFFEVLAASLAKATNPQYTFEELLNDIRQVLLTDGIL